MPNCHADLVEVFYHVYNAGGIAPGASVLGRTASSVSERILLLEEQLGEALFVRRPTFVPTARGEEFYRETAEPVGRALTRLRETEAVGAGGLLRVGASEYMLQEYVLPALACLQAERPGLRVTLRSGPREQLEGWVADNAIDLAVLTTDESPSGFGWAELLSLQLVLLVPANSGITMADTLWAQRPPAARLACPPPGEGVTRRFQGTLRGRGVLWRVTVDASCTALLPWIVAQGQAVGPCVGLPGLIGHPDVRALPLPGFEPVHVGIVHRAKLTSAAKTFVEICRRKATELKAQVARGPDAAGLING